MRPSADELLHRIHLGEDASLELKEVVFAGEEIETPSRDVLADAMAALANTRGGTVVLGVSEETREVRGIPPGRMDAVQSQVVEAACGSTEPPLDATVSRIALRGPDGMPRRVLHLEIPRSHSVHRSPSGYLRRFHRSTRELTLTQLERQFRERSQESVIHFDRQTIGASPEDLARPLRERFRTSRTRGSLDRLARKLGMLARDPRGALRPTVAGVLMASRRPDRWLGNAFIQAVHYRGRDLAEAWSFPRREFDAEDLCGPLDEQIEGACRFVFRNQNAGVPRSPGSDTMPRYDMESVFEALVNAVAHRDYSIHGSHIRLRMFADRIELHSPGGLPNSMEIDLLAHQQATRNELIANLLRAVPIPRGKPWLQTTRQTFMDRRGEGVPIILERSEALSGRKPEYRLLGDSELMLTIYAAGPVESGYIGSSDGQAGCR